MVFFADTYAGLQPFRGAHVTGTRAHHVAALVRVLFRTDVLWTTALSSFTCSGAQEHHAAAL